MSKINE
jgi:muconolactone delta-isomerase